MDVPDLSKYIGCIVKGVYLKGQEGTYSITVYGEKDTLLEGFILKGSEKEFLETIQKLKSQYMIQPQITSIKEVVYKKGLGATRK